MKITKGSKTVKANCDNFTEIVEVDNKGQAINCILSAIDLLALCDDEICKESIANLSVVLLDLKSTDLPSQESVTVEEVLEETPSVEIPE